MQQNSIPNHFIKSFDISFQEQNDVSVISGRDVDLSRTKFLISFALKKDIHFMQWTVPDFTNVLILIVSHAYVDVSIKACSWILVVENAAKLMKPMPAG